MTVSGRLSHENKSLKTVTHLEQFTQSNVRPLLQTKHNATHYVVQELQNTQNTELFTLRLVFFSFAFELHGLALPKIEEKIKQLNYKMYLF